MPFKVVGLDPSLTGTGICIIDNRPSLEFRDMKGLSVITTKITNELQGPERLIYIRDNVLGYCRDAELVCIEHYAFSRANQCHQLGELGGVLRVALTEAGIKYVDVAPGQLKKFATGKVGAKKEEVAVGIFKRWGREFESNDEADAFVLASIGLELLGNGDGLVSFQREIVEALKNPGVKKKKSKKTGGGKGERAS